MRFAEQYELNKKVPLLEPENRNQADGMRMTAVQRADAEKSEKLLDQAIGLRKKGDYEAALKDAAAALKIRQELYPPTHYMAVSALSEEKSLRRYTQSPPEELAQLADSDKIMDRANEAYEKAEYASAVSLGSRALAIRERILGRGHHELGDCYRVIGASQIELLALDEAQQTLEKAVDTSEKAFGKGHPALARVLDRQGWLYINKGDVPKALSCLQTAVRIYGLTCGDTLDAAEAIDNLGTVLLIRGDPSEALTQKIRALVIREKLAGPDSKESATSYSNLAWTYTRLGAKEEILPLRKKALAIFERLLGPDHPYTSTEMVNLGVAYQNDGKVNEAIELYLRAVARDEKRKAPVDARVVNRCTRLGVAYFEAGKRDEADATLQKSAAKAGIVKEEGNPKAAAGEMKQIADVYEAYRMLDQACKTLEQAYQWDTQQGSSPDEPSILRSQQYCNLLVQIGRFKDAKNVIDRIMPIATKRFGRGDSKMTPLLLVDTLASAGTGELEQAERACDELVRISESKFGPESRQNAIALREMGRVYLLQKKPDLAKFSLDDARKLNEKYQDLEPVEMVRLLLQYGDMQVAAGQRAEAVKTLRDALERCRKLIGLKQTPHMNATLAKVLKKLLDAISSDSAADKEALRGELRTILGRLESEKALDAENKAWLQEMGGAAKG